MRLFRCDFGKKGTRTAEKAYLVLEHSSIVNETQSACGKLGKSCAAFCEFSSHAFANLGMGGIKAAPKDFFGFSLGPCTIYRDG